MLGEDLEEIHQDVASYEAAPSCKGLEKLGLFSLVQRRLRRDRIEEYKIMKGINRVDSNETLALIRIK